MAAATERPEREMNNAAGYAKVVEREREDCFRGLLHPAMGQRARLIEEKIIQLKLTLFISLLYVFLP